MEQSSNAGKSPVGHTAVVTGSGRNIGEAMALEARGVFLVGHPDLEETIAGLKAYAGAGADCLYAPGIRTRDQITAIVAAVAPTPVNLLVSSAGHLTVQDTAALRVRRISVGGALARSAWSGFIRALCKSAALM